MANTGTGAGARARRGKRDMAARLNYYHQNGRQRMKSTNDGGRKARALKPTSEAEALAMLESAVAYCMVAGFAVRAGNLNDELVIIVP